MMDQVQILALQCQKVQALLSKPGHTGASRMTEARAKTQKIGKMGSNGYFTDNIVAVHAMRRCL